MKSLVDQFCPQAHEAAITAAAYDIYTQTKVTADADGVVVVRRRGEPTPGLIFQVNGGIEGALSIQKGGDLIAVGDNSGSIGVYHTTSGDPIFFEERDGARGRKRAFRGVAINKQGTRLAAISVDKLLRIWDLQTHQRLFQWKGFSGNSIFFDDRGDRILAVDVHGQPNLIDIFRSENRYLQNLQTPCEHAMFTLDGLHILAAGPGGFYLLEAGTGNLAGGFATQRSSGIVDVVLSPDGRNVAAVTRRSVHVFHLPNLEPADSFTHNAPNPSNSAIWDNQDIWIGGEDGLMHSRQSGGGVPPVNMVNGFGARRLAVHANQISVWKNEKRRILFETSSYIEEAQINREGHLIIARLQNEPVKIFNSRTGEEVMKTPQNTVQAEGVHIGGSTIGIEMKGGGCYWWHLTTGAAFQLPWPKGMCISNGGDILAVITPQGRIRLLNSKTGKSHLAAPSPIAAAKIVRMSFVNRSPILVVFDEEGVLSYYDLAESHKSGKPASGKDLIQLGAPVDRMWGLSIENTQYAALRIQEDQSSTILWVDLNERNDPFTVEDLHPEAWVDPMTGSILEPARSGAILERDFNGLEKVVYRSLPGNQWLSFGRNGLLDRSENISSNFG